MKASQWCLYRIISMFFRFYFILFIEKKKPNTKWYTKLTRILK